MRAAMPLALQLALLGAGAAASDADVQPAIDVITRNFGKEAAASFDLSIKAGPCSESVPSPCFAISENSGKVSIVATSMSELTYGIGHYTRFSCGLTVGWRNGGNSFTDAAAWPCHKGTLAAAAVPRAVKYTYQDNVCTHSYSYVWYDYEEWVAHIDVMALQGINVFLAITGQEEIQYKTFKQFGLTDTEIREFFNGPAYLTWSRGQSMQSVGTGPSFKFPGAGSGLPRSWMQSQHALQKQILALARPLGIIGVLPAFQGNTPPQLKKLFPTANVSTTQDPEKGDEGNCAWISGSDPLFGKIADKWMETMIADFGTDHWYQCDGFFTGMAPPWYESAEKGQGSAAAVSKVSASRGAAAPPPVDPEKIEPAADWTPVWKGAWEGMSRTDPAAKWLYQGWAIRGWNNAEGAARLKALYDVVPPGQWIPLDMDVGGIWRYFGNYSFFGAPFIWTTLHDFGGNDGLKGDMRELSGMPGDALKLGATIVGTGTTMEGINQNPAYYDYTYDTAWHADAQPLDSWFAEYSSRRYGGTSNAAAAAAWKILETAVYNEAGCGSFGGYHDGTGVEWKVWGAAPTCTMDTAAVAKAWGLLNTAGAAVDPTKYATFNYDVVNTGREVLAQLITKFEHNLTTAVASKDKEAALGWGSALLEAYADIDELVGCDYGFLLGAWIADAKKWANASDAPESYYEWEARSQVSTWWPVPPSAREDPSTFHYMGGWKAPPLDGYANKHWNGLIRDFYQPRVACYIEQMKRDLPAGSGGEGPLNMTNITVCAVSAEMDFTQDTATKYAEVPTTDKTIALSIKLHAKWSKFL